MEDNRLEASGRPSKGSVILVIGMLFIAACPADVEDSQNRHPYPAEMDVYEDEGFMWPPPEPSATMVIPRSLFIASASVPPLVDTASRLEDALEAAGYFEVRYYEIPGGFAAVTRLERINPDGTPRADADRWNIGAQRNTRLRDLLIGMFRGNPGHYRIIAFVFTNESWEFEKDEVTLADATRWFTGGRLWLPTSTGRRPFTRDHVVTALIYEFHQRTVDDAALFVLPSQDPGKNSS